VVGALVKLGHSLAHVKIWGCSTPLRTKIWSSTKVDLGGYDFSHFTSRSLNLVDQSSPYFYFFSLNTGGIAVDQILVQFWISSSVLETIAVKVWSGLKSSHILRVF